MTEEMPSPGDMFYMALPPEVRAMIDHQHMHAESNAHETMDFLLSMDQEQLRKFRGILGTMSSNEGAIPYYMGLVGGILNQKFHICLACSKNHDEDLANMAHESDEPVELSNQDIADIKISMHEYGVKPVTDEDWSGQVVCTGPCEGAAGGATWANLEARMESRPGIAGCTFCQQKEAWG
jgi:hypothetical protein